MLIRRLQGLWGGFFQALFSWGWQQPLSEMWLPGCLWMTNGIHFSGSSVHSFCEPWLAGAKLWPHTAFVPQLWACLRKPSSPFLGSAEVLFCSPLVVDFFKVFLYFWAWRCKNMHILFSFMRPPWASVWLLGCRWVVLTTWWTSLQCLLGLLGGFFLVQIKYFRILAFQA